MNRAGRFRAKVGKEFKAWNERKRFPSFAIFADLCAFARNLFFFLRYARDYRPATCALTNSDFAHPKEYTALSFARSGCFVARWPLRCPARASTGVKKVDGGL
jgi:hypothetical protein